MKCNYATSAFVYHIELNAFSHAVDQFFKQGNAHVNGTIRVIVMCYFINSNFVPQFQSLITANDTKYSISSLNLLQIVAFLLSH